MPRKMRFCPACDTPAIITSRHCDNCGLLLPWSVPLADAALAAPAPATTPPAQAVPAASPPANPPAAGPQPAAKPLKWQPMAAIGAGIIGLAFVAVLATNLARSVVPPPTPTIPISVPPPSTPTRIAQRPTPVPPTPRPIIPIGPAEQLPIVEAIASSELTTSMGPMLAIDGKDATAWQADYAEKGTAWIELRLAQPVIIRTLMVHSRQPLRNLAVTYADGSVQRLSLPQVEGWQTIDLGPARGDRLRITFEGVYANDSQVAPEIDEIQVWGEFE